jgi:hypothetical protein
MRHSADTCRSEDQLAGLRFGKRDEFRQRLAGTFSLTTMISGTETI